MELQLIRSFIDMLVISSEVKVVARKVDYAPKPKPKRNSSLSFAEVTSSLPKTQLKMELRYNFVNGRNRLWTPGHQCNGEELKVIYLKDISQRKVVRLSHFNSIISLFKPYFYLKYGERCITLGNPNDGSL